MDAFLEFLGKFDTFFKLALCLLSILGVWGYFYHKSGSAYSMLDKLWSIFVGKKEFYNATINQFHQDRHDIDKFNSVYNVSAINTNEIEMFTQWIKRKDQDTRKISAIKGWFNISRLEPIPPNGWMTLLVFIVSLALILSSLFLIIWGASPNAFVKLDQKEPWLIINHHRAKPASQKLWINAENCSDWHYNKNDYAKKTGLSLKTVDEICNSFTDERDVVAIDKIIKGQRVLAYFGTILFLFGLYIFILFIRRINAIDFNKLYQRNHHD